MKARLQNGEIVTLPKDCQCLAHIHTGPHWIHMDAFDKRQNRAVLGDDVTPEGLRERIKSSGYAMQLEALFHWFAESELRRLREKRHNMERAGIVEIIHQREDNVEPTEKRLRKPRKKKAEKIWTGERVILSDPR
ncbi:MAG: hypothetical protein ACREDR_00440 [Blastocatellia bacterium]